MSALLTVVLVSALAQTPESRAQNTAGFRLYQAKKYAEAIAAFRDAVSKDGKNALAHYNLAATLGLVRGAGKTCEFDAYAGTIMGELQEAMTLDVRRKLRARVDSDFKSVWSTFAWQTKVLDRSVAKNLSTIVVAVTWYSPSQGAYGPQQTLVFKAKGRGVERKLEGEDPKLVDRAFTWKVKGTGVEVRRADGSVQTYVLGEDGRLTSGESVLTDDRGECSA